MNLRSLVHHLSVELLGSRGNDGGAGHCRVAHDDPGTWTTQSALRRSIGTLGHTGILSAAREDLVGPLNRTRDKGEMR